jgi:cellulose synthase/poly-beta-1,6-N-acetylglucosamine synthase-like glycosyltransferase
MIFENSVFLIVGILVSFAYALVILLITWGWFNLKQNTDPEDEPMISVIVAARNEEKNILNCLQSISNQNYNPQRIEIIVVDDHSTDQTAGITQDFIKNHTNFNISLLKQTKQTGKKSALRLALTKAKGEYILITDADCLHKQGWIKSMASKFISDKAVFVSGAVSLYKPRGIFQTLQDLEFMSLVASGAGSIGAGFPMMCNGANLGFSLSAYRQLSENEIKPELASGDDIFLMMAFANKFGKDKIAFVKDRNAMVYTNPINNFGEFMQQRLRWTSKSKAYRDLPTILTALSVLLMNAFISVMIIMAIVNIHFLPAALVIIFIKTLIDFPLMMAYAKFSGQQKYLWAFLPAEPLVALYTTFTGMAGQFINVKWKGRRINGE